MVPLVLVSMLLRLCEFVITVDPEKCAQIDAIKASKDATKWAIRLIFIYPLLCLAIRKSLPTVATSS